MQQSALDTSAQSRNLGRFLWYELATSDVEGAKTFYTSVMGWGTQPFEGAGMPYTVWTAHGKGIGGVAALEGGKQPRWIAYVRVSDVDATLARAAELGGSVVMPATDIPQVGRLAVLADPQGAAIALLAPDGEDQPPEDDRQTGRIGWNELTTTDSAAALAFYAALFGWQPASEMDMGEHGTYKLFHHPADAADAWLGGMSDMAKHMHVPPFWLYYVNVDTMQGAIARITAGGGKILNGPMDVPGGQAAQCQDPQGAMFAIFAQQA